MTGSSETINKYDEYGRNRRLYLAECVFEYLISILVTGSYLAKLTTSIGISDEMTAILSELTTVSGIFQIFSIYLSHKRPVKKWLMPLMILPQILFALVYLIPLFDLKLSSSVLLFVIILLARSLASVCGPVKIGWLISYVEPSKRGRFTATNTIISLLASIAFTFVIGVLIDYYEALGDLNKAYLIFSIIILVFTVFHFLTLLFVKDDPNLNTEKKTSPFGSMKNLLSNREFKRVTLLYTIVSIAGAVITPFLGTFQINELGFSMTLISTLNIIMTVLNVVCVFLVGKYSVHTKYSKLIISSVYFYSIAFIFIAMSTTATGLVTYTLYHIVMLISGAYYTIGVNNLLYDIVSPEERVSALALKTIVTSIAGFATTLLFTPLVTYIQGAGNTFLGLKVYAQQVLAVIAVLIYVIAMLFYHLACKKLLDKKNV